MRKKRYINLYFIIYSSIAKNRHNSEYFGQKQDCYLVKIAIPFLWKRWISLFCEARRALHGSRHAVPKNPEKGTEGGVPSRNRLTGRRGR